MYARKSPEEVYSALSSIGTNYIILEDSICLAAPSPNNSNCRLTDIMDIVDTSHSYDTAPKQLRFCDGVRYGGNYAKNFALVFVNRTFRVYKLKQSTDQLVL